MKIINLQFFNKKKEQTLDEIIEGCIKEDPKCQEMLFKLFLPKLMTICRRYEHPSFGASDILQETFIRVFENIKKYDAEKASIETWMKKIAVNTALNIMRARKIFFLDLDESYTQIADEKAIAQDVESISEEYIIEVIQRLPIGYRTVFNMYAIDGFSHKEIAEYLNISVQTSKSQLFKAKKMLRIKLKFYSEEKKDIN